MTLLSDESRPGGVTFAFTERTGGVSTGDYASLNLGSRCGDDPSAVGENRRRALAALGCANLLDRLVSPRQVHGDSVVVVCDGSDDAVEAAQAEAEAGADAVVCLAKDVPVLLNFADCVPVVLAAPGAFAVAHSGWRGTYARIAAKALGILSEEAGCSPRDVSCYIGPHIRGCDYEVSQELLDMFVAEFGESVDAGCRRLDLARAITMALTDAGASPEAIVVCEDSTATNTDRFFSYRAEKGRCGRHGAMAVLLGGEVSDG